MRDAVHILTYLFLMTWFAGCAGGSRVHDSEPPPDYAGPPTTEGMPSDRDKVTGEETFSTGIGGCADSYRRVLSIRVSDLAEEYVVNEPIPITVCIKNHHQELHENDEDPGHPQAQLFPFLTVWVEKSPDRKPWSQGIDLPIENRIWIRPCDTFTYTVDLSGVKRLSQPGTYTVSIGHRNSMVLDMGDWTGILRSRNQTIRIFARQ